MPTFPCNFHLDHIYLIQFFFLDVFQFSVGVEVDVGADIMRVIDWRSYETSTKLTTLLTNYFNNLIQPVQQQTVRLDVVCKYRKDQVEEKKTTTVN